MKEPIVIIGIGELAGVFARGFLRCGYPVYPITRSMDMAQESRQIPTPSLVLVTVQENQLHPVLEQLPESWRSSVGLLQNELLPRDWQAHNISNPTVTVVWFEKKKTLELTNVLYTPSYGPKAPLLAEALEALEIPFRILEDEDALLYELARKSVYILTVNIAGLMNNCTVEELWYRHQALARDVAEEVISILESLTGEPLPRETLIAGMVAGIDDCPNRNCLGRRAMSRLERSLQHAKEAGIKTPIMSSIYKKANPA